MIHTQVVVDSMHERKLEMAKRSCGFICLPGGYGTFEEVRPNPLRPRSEGPDLTDPDTAARSHDLVAAWHPQQA